MQVMCWRKQRGMEIKSLEDEFQRVFLANSNTVWTRPVLIKCALRYNVDMPYDLKLRPCLLIIIYMKELLIYSIECRHSHL